MGVRRVKEGTDISAWMFLSTGWGIRRVGETASDRAHRVEPRLPGGRCGAVNGWTLWVVERLGARRLGVIARCGVG
jgi:hypothetical protein